MKKIIVSDVTLKAFKEQKTFLTFREKLLLAQRLDALKVDVLELPELTNSKEDMIINRTISESMNNAMVVVPVGASKESVSEAVDCVKNASSWGLQVKMPVSTAQMEYMYHLKAPAMQQKIVELVKMAKESTDNVEFVAVDAFRAEKDFVISVIKACCEAGVKSVTVSDDAGVAFPEDFASLVKAIKDSCDVKVFVQPSDFLTLATASVIEAIKAGADGVKTSVFGNYLKLAVFADVIRSKKYDMGVDANVDVTNVKTVSEEIFKDAGEGDSVESKSNLQHIDSSASISEVANAIKQLGYELSDADVGNVYEEFKKLTAKKETIDTKELEAVIASTAMQVPSTYHLVNYVVNSGNIIPATANVTLEKDGEKFTGVSTGDGPIDAAFHAIEQVIGHHYELDDFQVQAVTKGRGAVGSSLIRLRANGKLYPGNGVSTDIIGACVRAYVNALNKIVYEEK